MFTGIVERVGIVRSATQRPGRTRLEIDAQGWADDVAAGESIAVAGVCLTAVAPGNLAFDVVPETLARTTLGSARAGSRVNLERCVRASTLMSGHVVQGHVEGLGTIETMVTQGEHRVRIGVDRALLESIVPKGSVAVDGVSLTVARVEAGGGAGRGWFEVALIPTTLERTTLGDWRPGSACNIETDILARTVVHYLRSFGGGGPERGVD